MNHQDYIAKINADILTASRKSHMFYESIHGINKIKICFTKLSEDQVKTDIYMVEGMINGYINKMLELAEEREAYCEKNNLSHDDAFIKAEKTRKEIKRNVHIKDGIYKTIVLALVLGPEPTLDKQKGLEKIR